jgi:hypothetical protein
MPVAATAMENNMPLISVDEVCDGLADHADWIARLS